MLGAIAPDFDLLYFYLVDNGRHNHHSYVTHFPLTWALMFAAAALWYRASRQHRNIALLLLAFALNGFIHMVLDSFVGRIMWLAPFGDTMFSLYRVAREYDPWWANFLLHWTFLLELAITGWAALLWWRQRHARVELYPTIRL